MSTAAQQNFSGVGNVNFTSMISSYTYLVILKSSGTSTSTSIGLRFSTNNGSSYDAGNNYGWNVIYSCQGVTAVSHYDGSADSHILMQAPANQTIPGSSLVFYITVFNSGNSYYGRVNGHSVFYNGSEKRSGSNAIANDCGGTIEGVYQSSVPPNAFQLNWGETASGTVQVFQIIPNPLFSY